MAGEPDCSSAGLGKMAAMVRTHSYTMAFPIVCPVLARRIASPTTVYMFSLAALSPAPSSASVFSSFICARAEYISCQVKLLTASPVHVKRWCCCRVWACAMLAPPTGNLIFEEKKNIKPHKIAEAELGLATARLPLLRQ